LARSNLRKISAHRISCEEIQMPKFKNESEEADWWSSREGRDSLKRKSSEAQSKGTKTAGSRLVSKIAKKNSIQIAIR